MRSRPRRSLCRQNPPSKRAGLSQFDTAAWGDILAAMEVSDNSAGHNTGQVNHWLAFLAHLLFILAAWTVVIKYLFPVAFALSSGEPWSRYIFWDLWPVAHIWLGWALLKMPPYTKWLAVVMSVVEIAIIVSLFAWFLSDPDWTIWRTNWFINKIFVLLAFVLILATALLRREAFRNRAPNAEPPPQTPQST